MAVYCCVPPTVTVALLGDTWIVVSVGDTTLTVGCDAVPRLALSSTARARSDVEPTTVGSQA